MSMPANLFVDTPEMEDVSLHHLGNDVEAWPEEIITKLKERLPTSSGMNIMVKFMKKDDENGTATGSVLVNSASKVVVVPIIIKDFMLFPLDVMITDSKLLPLTADMFAAVMQRNALFDTIEEYPQFGGLGRFEDGNLWNTIYPPSLGRYAYASAGYPILDSVSSTIDGSDMATYLRDPANAKTAARLLSGPHKEVIQKVAQLRPLSLQETKTASAKMLQMELAMLRQAGNGTYEILQNSQSMFHPSLLKMERRECHKLLSALGRDPEDDFHAVTREGEHFIALPPQPTGPVLSEDGTDAEMPVEAVLTGNYMVRMNTGVACEGLVVTKVINFDMKPMGTKLFLGKTMACMQETIWGIPCPDSLYRPAACSPKVGQTGTFLYMKGKNQALATMPVTIASITDDLGVIEFKVMDLLGGSCRLRINTAFQLETIVAVEPGLYQMPHGLHWIPMEGFGSVSNSSYDYHVKTAGALKRGAPVTLIATGYNQYAMRGVDKYASAMSWDKGNLAPYQVKFLLASLGAGAKDISSAVKTAEEKGKTELYGLKQPPLTAEKVAAARPLATAIYSQATALRANLLKEASLLQELPGLPETPWFKKQAAYLENSQTVDALLSLNFVSPTNITKYIAKLPSLKAAISHLAGCLIASRLGMKEIPESSAAAAMLRMVEVVNGLEKLKAMQQVTAQRS